MIGLSDQKLATNPQCYKDREDYSIDVVFSYSVVGAKRDKMQSTIFLCDLFILKR